MKRFFQIAGFGFLCVVGALLPGSFALADTSITSNITASTTWSNESGVYIIENSISIDSGVTLTIDPGVVVKFRSSSVSLTVNGTLDAQGTATSSIYFTSINDDIGGDTNGTTTPPDLYDWRYIVSNANAATTLNYTVVRYGGTIYGTDLFNNGGTLSVLNSTIASSTYGIYHSGGITNIATSTISDSSQYGIQGSGSGTVSISNSTFSNNATAAGYFDLDGGLTLTNSGNTASGTGKRGFFVYASSLGASQTWQADTIPYIIPISGFTIPSGKTLTLNQGAIVKFDRNGDYYAGGLTVNGILDAQGAASSSVYFTSIRDDTVGGDTDGNNGNPAPDDWKAIQTGTGATTTLSYSVIRYGGDTYGYDLYNNGGTLSVLNSTIASSSVSGVRHVAGTTNIATSTLNGSWQYGVHSSGSGTVSITDSNFYDNSYAAAYFDLDSGLTISHSGNTASGTGERGFVMYASSLGADQTWNPDGVPYIISVNGLTIPAGKTITIKPDAVVKFNNQDYVVGKLIVNGTLNATSTAGHIIYFTSINDDILNDTNGTATPAAAGDWKWIETGTNATTTLSYTFVGYGGYSDGYM